MRFHMGPARQVDQGLKGLRAAPPGPVAALLCDGALMAAASARWALRLGAAALVVIGPDAALRRAAAAAQDLGLSPAALVPVPAGPVGRDAAPAWLAALAPALDGRWVLPLFNGEFPVFPWCESRGLADLAAFQEGERRRGVGGWVVDMHAPGLAAAAEADDPDWAPPGRALYDLGGCFALTGAPEPWEAEGAGPVPPEAPRLYGGVGWRFQERFARPPRLDRTAFFRAFAGMTPDETFRLGDPKADGLSGAWHRSPTMAVMSFRTARALLAQPEMAENPPELGWSGARSWGWSSGELLDAGVIEPGQWF
ncbi:hypothetical protein ACQ5SO_12815 [Rhodovulum sp. DZ06]|uniref:hypothetical protein n=1 Tax=Rhodovulum sp. DZ06 TaxID=3425126 RepID=UPI003D32D713